MRLSILLGVLLLAFSITTMAREYPFSAEWDQPDSADLNLPERGLFWNVRHCIQNVEGSCVVVRHAEIGDGGQPVVPLALMREGEPLQVMAVDVQACVETPIAVCSDWSDQALATLPQLDVTQPGSVNITIEFKFSN